MPADRNTGSRLQLHGTGRLPRVLIRHSRRKKEPQGFSRVSEALQLDEREQTQGSVVIAEEILQENTSLPLEIPSGPINSNLRGAVVTELCQITPLYCHQDLDPPSSNHCPRSLTFFQALLWFFFCRKVVLPLPCRQFVAIRFCTRAIDSVLSAPPLAMAICRHPERNAAASLLLL